MVFSRCRLVEEDILVIFMIISFHVIISITIQLTSNFIRLVYDFILLLLELTFFKAYHSRIFISLSYLRFFCFLIYMCLPQTILLIDLAPNLALPPYL